MPGSDGCANRRREQHRHALGLTLVPRRNRPLGVLKDLRAESTPRRGLLLGLALPRVFHLALIEAHVELYSATPTAFQSPRSANTL
jgi:hypothetical protein